MPTSEHAVGRRSHAPDERTDGDFVVPVVHLHVSEPTMKLGFYGGLAAAVALGAVDLPVGVLIGLGVAIARHRRT
jgi:hypothetical protein